MNSKKCTKCGGAGPFGPSKQTRDGLTNYCTACLRIYRSNWHKNNPGKRKDYARVNYARNTEQARVERRAYYAANKENMNDRSRNNYHDNKSTRLVQIATWKQQNWSKVIAIASARRARKAGASGTSTEEQIAQRIGLYGGMCAYCGAKPHEHLDHAIPLSRGGSQWPANIRPSCATCNLSKNDNVWFVVTFTQEPIATEAKQVKHHMRGRELARLAHLQGAGAVALVDQMLGLAERFERTDLLSNTDECTDCGAMLDSKDALCPNRACDTNDTDDGSYDEILCRISA